MPVFKSMHVGCRSSANRADRTDRAGGAEIVGLWFAVWHFGLAMLARLCFGLGIGLGIGLASVTAASAQNAVTEILPLFFLTASISFNISDNGMEKCLDSSPL